MNLEAVEAIIEQVVPEDLKRLAVVRAAMAQHDLDFVGAIALFDDVEPADVIKSLMDAASQLAVIGALHVEQDVLSVESQVSAFTGEPSVLIRQAARGDQPPLVIGLTPMQARHHAQSVHEAAEAAEHDAALHAWVRQEMDGDYEKAAAIVTAIRGFRRRYREAQGEPETYRGP